MTDSCNIAAALPRLAAEQPDRVAMRCPGSRGPDGLARYDVSLTYAELDVRSDAIAAGLALRGVVRGSRTVVMVRPSPEFFLLMFALFKAGAVPVLVDPGIDKRALKQCLAESEPQAFIGVPLAHVGRKLLGWARSVRVTITTGRRAWLSEATLDEVEQEGADALARSGDAPSRRSDNGDTPTPFAALTATAPDDVAAILFTSGSTGIPKGVVYRHRHFIAQLEMLRDAFGIVPGGVNLATFPPFALFDPALGVTSIIPDMDPTRPANADPRKLCDAITRFGVNQLFGSPALMAVLARHGQPLPTLKRVMSAGAPVPAHLVAKLQRLLPADACFWTPYGATECLPVSMIEGRELETTGVATASGAGTCVGRPVTPNVVRIIRITDEAISEWSDALCVPTGEVGEITVTGPTTTDSYFHRVAQTRLAKIREESQARTVHRMGDLGYLDADGRLWFCGRKSDRLQTSAGPLYTEQVEPVFNSHPEVRRTALVGIGEAGASQPVLCVELAPGVNAKQWPRIERELGAMAASNPHTAGIVRFLHHPGFPVDIRHNAKIGRPALARWAAGKR
ncbi:olefin beta-lactone synthetase [Lysobacter sp. A378]